MAALEAMTAGILILTHAPLASALRDCLLHVFPDRASNVAAFDVPSGADFESSVARARACIDAMPQQQVIVFTDVFGATPCNVAREVVDGVRAQLVAGVNLPMLLRAVTYLDEPMDSLVARAVSGGVQGVMRVATVAPQIQGRKRNDQDDNDHQQ